MDSEGLDLEDPRIVSLDRDPATPGLNVPEAFPRCAFIDKFLSFLERPDIQPTVGWETGRLSSPAALDGNLASLQLYLFATGSIDAVNSKGRSAPFNVCAAGQTEVITLLLSHQANVQLPAYGFSTRLHWACRYGHAAAVQLLLQAGADPDASNMLGDTPAHEAAAVGQAMPRGRDLLRSHIIAYIGCGNSSTSGDNFMATSQGSTPKVAAASGRVLKRRGTKDLATVPLAEATLWQLLQAPLGPRPAMRLATLALMQMAAPMRLQWDYSILPCRFQRSVMLSSFLHPFVNEKDDSRRLYRHDRSQQQGQTRSTSSTPTQHTGPPTSTSVGSTSRDDCTAILPFRADPMPRRPQLPHGQHTARPSDVPGTAIVPFRAAPMPRGGTPLPLHQHSAPSPPQSRTSHLHLQGPAAPRQFHSASTPGLQSLLSFMSIAESLLSLDHVDP